MVFVNFCVYPHQKLFIDNLLSKGYIMRPCEVGEIEGNYVEDYKMLYLNLYPNEDDAFGELL